MHSQLSMYEKLSTQCQCVLWNGIAILKQKLVLSQWWNLFSLLLRKKGEKPWKKHSLEGSNSSPCSSRSDSQAGPQRLHEVAAQSTCPLLTHHSQPDLVTCRTLQPHVQEPQVLTLPFAKTMLENHHTFLEHMWDGINQRSSLSIPSGRSPFPPGREMAITPTVTLVWGKTGIAGALITLRDATDLSLSPQVNAIKEHHRFPTAVQVLPKFILSLFCSHCFLGEKGFSRCTQQQKQGVKRKRWVPRIHDKR